MQIATMQIPPRIPEDIFSLAAKLREILTMGATVGAVVSNTAK